MLPEIKNHIDAVRALCLKHRVRSLWLIGSALDGEFNPSQSDLDFLVEFHPHGRRGFDDVYFLLWEDLQRLFDRRIDLVEFGAITNPYFRQSVEYHRVPLYAAA